jgi:hypothetical protein
MMKEHDLDRLIDRATEEMIGREPDRSLRQAVMVRVRESRAAAPRRLTWATFAAAAILCGAIAIALMNREAVPLVTGRDIQLSERAPGAPVLVPPGERTDGHSAPALTGNEAARESAPPATRPAPKPVKTTALPPNDLLAIIEPITADPLVLPSIELPPLENQTTAVEELEIEALTIEPLTASND